MKKADNPIKFRWEVFPVLFILILGILIYKLLVPMAYSVFQDALGVYNQAKMKEDSGTVEKRIVELQKKIIYIDSLVSHISDYDTLQSADVISDLYTLADSVGLSTSKIESGTVLKGSSFSETPVVVRGQGEYKSMGRFVAGIENLDIPTRIRQVTMKNKDDGEGELYLDFVIMSGK